MNSVVQGLRPSKPHNASDIGLSDSLWDFLGLCWNQDRKRRPVAKGLVERLAGAARQRIIMPPTTTKSGPTEIEPSPLDLPETSNPRPRSSSSKRSQEKNYEYAGGRLTVVTPESNNFPSVRGEPRVSQ